VEDKRGLIDREETKGSEKEVFYLRRVSGKGAWGAVLSAGRGNTQTEKQPQEECTENGGQLLPTTGNWSRWVTASSRLAFLGS